MIKLTLHDLNPAEIWVNPDTIVSFHQSRYKDGTHITLAGGRYLAVAEEPSKVAWDIRHAYRQRHI